MSLKPHSKLPTSSIPATLGWSITIGGERGWPPSSRSQFNAQLGPLGAFLIGNAEEVADKILRHSKALGGVSRVTFQMDNQSLPHDQLMRSIDLIANGVMPVLSTRNDLLAAHVLD